MSVDLAAKIRDVPDFPKPGIVFKDIMPLLADKEALREAVDRIAEWAQPKQPDLVLGAEDQVAMVVYAGNSGCVLEPTHSKAKMRAALKKLEAGGSTNGASGIQLAYELAEKSFIKGGTNRVILATDGDWNVGITNPADLFDMIAKKAKHAEVARLVAVGGKAASPSPR